MANTRIKLTKTYIDSISEPGIYHDSELIGFAIRVNTTCKLTLLKKVNSKVVRSTIGLHGNLTLAQARILAQGVLSKMAQGYNPNQIKKEKSEQLVFDNKIDKQQTTLEIVYGKYLKHRKLKNRSLKDYNRTINQYLSDWKKIKLVDIASMETQLKKSITSLIICGEHAKSDYEFIRNHLAKIMMKKGR